MNYISTKFCILFGNFWHLGDKILNSNSWYCLILVMVVTYNQWYLWEEFLKDAKRASGFLEMQPCWAWWLLNHCLPASNSSWCILLCRTRAGFYKPHYSLDRHRHPFSELLTEGPGETGPFLDFSFQLKGPSLKHLDLNNLNSCPFFFQLFKK